jgi:glycosyltransferase involved in cell wall biosynthesis
LRAAGFPGEKLHVTRFGVPLRGFAPSRDGAMRRELGLENAFVAGYVGRMEIERGLWTLLHAVRRLPETVKCLCVGGGAWRRGFEKKAAELGLEKRFVCVGEVPREKVASFLNAMDVLVLPCERELGAEPYFVRVLPEGMACGVPVLGADVGAVREIIGEAGLTFPERDFLRLAGIVRRLAGDSSLCRRLGRAGLARARSEFDCDAFADRLLALYGGAADARPLR